jgi:predicted HTH domain antitoxin
MVVTMLETEKVQIKVPKQIKQAGFKQADLQEAIAVTLYYKEALTLKDACELTGKTRRQFEEALADYGFSTYGHTSEDVEFELNA